ncbi:BolA family protein [Cardiosporidium cionae]|uniref:BolA family protein n=1 Tax=Cardiosporidium cionae TaxID=476202 RepID=A0ABQ7JEF6_9APIC|nr:BolA family protein [Cardiosporidium cionae]|eukprot:KAF8822384.1 BolA family protein [Cardiosporidium cionae]
MVTEEGLKRKITGFFSPLFVSLVDTSGGCGAAFQLVIVSDTFAGKTQVQRHRMVNEVLHEEMKEIHALSMKCRTPLEWEKK